MAEERKQKEVNVAARLGAKEVEKLGRVMDLMEVVTGERNTSAALRYIVANFDIESSPLGEDEALAAHADRLLEGERNGKIKRVSEAELDARLIAAGLLDG